MSVESTRAALTAYLDSLVQRGPYAQYFTDDVTFTLMGPNQEVKGRDAVEQFIRYLHEQAFDAQPELKNTIIGDGNAAAEIDFVGTHTGEFIGVPASGKEVRVPYSVVYDLQGDKITALRAYMPMDALLQQIGGVPEARQAGA
jgi:steroid delta-isomerase-like uncharacterized protein